MSCFSSAGYGPSCFSSSRESQHLFDFYWPQPISWWLPLSASVILIFPLLTTSCPAFSSVDYSSSCFLPLLTAAPSGFFVVVVFWTTDHPVFSSTDYSRSCFCSADYSPSCFFLCWLQPILFFPLLTTAHPVFSSADYSPSCFFLCWLQPILFFSLCWLHPGFLFSVLRSPWDNRTGWLGVKH